MAFLDGLLVYMTCTDTLMQRLEGGSASGFTQLDVARSVFYGNFRAKILR